MVNIHLDRIPNEVRDRILEGVVQRLGGADGIKPGILTGPRDRDRAQIFSRRRTKKEREADPSLSQFEELAAIQAAEIDAIIAKNITEEGAVDQLIQRITNGRDVLKEVDPKQADVLRAYIDEAARKIINDMLTRAQQKKLDAEKAEKEQELLKANIQPPLPENPPQAVVEAVQRELAGATKLAEPDPEGDAVRWALANNFKPQYDKRSKSGYKKAWVATMQEKMEATIQAKLADDEMRRQKMLAGSGT